MTPSESKFSHSSTAGRSLNLGFVVLFCFLVLSIIVLSWVPPVGKDALTHHLAVPKLYLKHGGIHEMSDILFSYYPMNLDLLYMIPLYFGRDILPKLIHFSFALLTAFLMLAWLRKKIDVHYGWIGAILFLSLPIVVKLSISAYVDLGLVFFSTASILCLLRWLERRYAMRYLIVSAVCCGLALGTKYNALPVFLLLTFFVAFYYVRSDAETSSGRRQMKGIGYAILFVLISLGVFSPWMVRNMVWTHNPVYPLYDKWFNPPQPPPAEKKAETTKSVENKASLGLDHFTKRRINYNEAWWQIFLVPARIFFEGRDDDPRFFDGKLNPLLFFLPFLAFLKPRRNNGITKTETHLLMSFSVCYLALVFFSSEMRIRYIAPIIPPLVLLSVIGVYRARCFFYDQWATKGPAIAVGSASVLVCIYLLINAAYIVDQFKSVDPLAYIRGEVTREEYIERRWGDYAAIRFANAHLPENAGILGIFTGKRLYYSDRKMTFNVWTFKSAVERSKSVEEIRDRLFKKGITHLLVRQDLFMIWSKTNLNADSTTKAKAFFHQGLRLLYAKNGYSLFELTPTLHKQHGKDNLTY